MQTRRSTGVRPSPPHPPLQSLGAGAELEFDLVVRGRQATAGDASSGLRAQVDVLGSMQPVALDRRGVELPYEGAHRDVEPCFAQSPFVLAVVAVHAHVVGLT